MHRALATALAVMATATASSLAGPPPAPVPLAEYLRHYELIIPPWEILAQFEVYPTTLVAVDLMPEITPGCVDFLAIPLLADDAKLCILAPDTYWLIQRSPSATAGRITAGGTTAASILSPDSLVPVVEYLFAATGRPVTVSPDDLVFVPANQRRGSSAYYIYNRLEHDGDYQVETHERVIFQPQTGQPLRFEPLWPWMPDHLTVHIPPVQAEQTAFEMMEGEGWEAFVPDAPVLTDVTANNFAERLHARTHNRQEPDLTYARASRYAWMIKVAQPATGFHGIKRWLNRSLGTQFSPGRPAQAVQIYVDCETGEIIAGEDSYY